MFSASGLPESLLTDFVFSHSTISAESMGTMTFTQEWMFNDVKMSFTQPAPTVKQVSKEEKERLQ
jgi:hypothetical protein